jgi:hypothetical protein
MYCHISIIRRVPIPDKTIERKCIWAAGRGIAAAEQTLQAAAGLVAIPNAGGRYSTRILPDPDRVEVVRRQVAAAIQELSEKQP